MGAGAGAAGTGAVEVPGQGRTRWEVSGSAALSGMISPIFSIFCLLVSRTMRIPRPFFSLGSSSAFWDAWPIVGDASIGPIGWGGAGTKVRRRVRISLRMRIFIPWSAMVQESCVDSEDGMRKKTWQHENTRNLPSIPGNFLAVYT